MNFPEKYNIFFDRVSKLEGRTIEIIQCEEQREKKKKNKQSLRDPWDNFKKSNWCLRGQKEYGAKISE